MSTNKEAPLAKHFNYPDTFYSTYVERAARALIPKARAARPTVEISLPPGETQ